ncbi:MAG: PEP-CTERM sorting domain-containing protein [Planctomycetota bacterium]|jgi:hypothetical protein
MKTIASMAAALALLAVLDAPASADEVYAGTIHQGSPQSLRPGYPPTLTNNPDGRGRLTWGSGSHPPLTLGLDFEVLFWQGITITELGVWDDTVVFPDGSTEQVMNSSVTLTLWLWHDDGSYEALAGYVTDPDDPYQGALRGDYRYFGIRPTALNQGQKFTVTVGYGNENQDSSGNSGTTTQNLEPRPTFDGRGVVANIGSGRYGLDQWNFPSYTDTGPANRYHSGSFGYYPSPEPGTLLLVGGALSVVGVVRRRRRKSAAR